MAVIDIERPRWRAGEACEIAGITRDLLGMWRKHDGLKIGTLDVGGWRFSALDVAELAAIPALRAFGFEVGSAIKIAREHLRPTLRDILNNRLVYGFWSLSLIELDGDDVLGQRAIFLDQVAERVIVKLALPLPVDPMPRSPQIALRMVDAIFNYIESPPGRIRWRKWHLSAMERGGNIPIAQAAAELGAPRWFLIALDAVLHHMDSRDAIAEAVRPRAPKAAEHLRGITLQ